MSGLLIPELLFQAFSPNGGFLSGGLLSTFQAGTNIPATVYGDPALTGPLTNPVQLNSLGQALIYLTPGQPYKFNLTDSQGNQIPGYPVDQVNSNLSFPSIVSNIIPATTNFYTLGNSTFQWQAVYAQTVFQNGVPVVSYPITPGETAAGVTPINFQYPPLCVDRYFNNTNTNDSAPAFGNAFAAAVKSQGGTITYGATGIYTTLTPVNFTTQTSGSNQYPITLLGVGLCTDSFSSPTIIINHGGQTYSHGFDLTGTQGMTFQNVTIGTSAVTIPNTAIFQARTTGGGTCGICRFINVGIQGYFTAACYYNYGAEDCEVSAAYWQNNYTALGASVVFLTGNNVKGQTSLYATVDTGSVSMTDHKFFGGQFLMNSGNASSDIFYIEAIEGLKCFGCWFFGGFSGGGGGRAHVYCDLSHGASSFCDFYGISSDTSGANTSAYFFDFSNNTQTPVGWTIDGVKSATNTLFLSSGSLVTLNGFSIRGVTEVTTHGINIPGTLSGSFLATGEMPVAVPGTFGPGNIFFGNKTVLTTGTFTGSRMINTHSGQVGPWGTPVSGGIVSNFPGTGATLSQCGQVLSTIIQALQSEGIFD